ncbi:MAG TPA: BlaI/MecI/CopY family transcriptional regulator [Gemmataceae bacterium]|nr:BlaI/MecI/CopY family transcriptional regulator [Gemmataceae bacterium]
MARPTSSQPTQVELQILRILWQTGGATAREVHNALAEVELKDTTYSTTVKMLAVMLEKGLAKRDESISPQVYRAASSRQTTQRRMMRDLIDKVFDGSALSLVMQALSSRKASKEDLAVVRRLLDELG